MQSFNTIIESNLDFERPQAKSPHGGHLEKTLFRRSYFGKVFQALKENENKINHELLGVQKKPVDIGGYYHPSEELMSKAMRPSQTFNKILAGS